MSTERHLCFTLGKEQFAIPLLDVKEVIALPEITPVPQTPSYFLGIMNLRGQVISVVDLRTKLGMKPDANTDSAVIICDLQPNPIGVVVDSIQSVLAIPTENIAAKPDMPASPASDCLTGVYNQEKNLVLLMDLKLALSNDRGLANKATQAPRKAA